MVAVIKTGHSLQRILNYNENKIKEGQAECIGQGNYPMEAHEMSFGMKLNRLLRLAELNANVTRNSVHISLNFDPSEKDLEMDKLNAIAGEYMHRIGFGKQPYLVYQHYDAGHPHLHIVSVKVRSDGSRIDMQNIGKNQSEAARQFIEMNYGLVRAASVNKQIDKGKAPSVSKVIYGKNDSRRAITNVLDCILPYYKYTSLPELNAVLKQYNIIADRGSEKSRVYQNGGLMYRILDEQGNKVGVPLKASAIYNKPTLAYLEKRFPLNEIARAPSKGKLKNVIDRNLLGRERMEMATFCRALEKEGIHTVLRQNDSGILYGITYVDHTTKCIFNGSALGKPYSAKGIQQRCGFTAGPENKSTISTGASELRIDKPVEYAADTSISLLDQLEKTLNSLSRPENTSDYMPRQYRKKKKRKGRSDNP